MKPLILLPFLCLVGTPSFAQADVDVSPSSHASASFAHGAVGLEPLGFDAFIGAGADYKVSFTPGAVAVTPFLGMAAPYNLPLTFELLSIQLGDEPLLVVETPARPRSEAKLVTYEHGGAISERYELRSEGVYQSFEFGALPDVSGDLVVRGRITTELLPSADVDTGAGITFALAGVGGLVYESVFGIDAEGVRFPGSLQLVGDVLELRLPAADVARAALPLVLDPLIGSSFQLNVDVADEYDADVAYSPQLNRSLVVWERHISLTDSDIYGIQVQNGAPTGTLRLIETGGGVAINPSVGFVPLTSRFLVAWQNAPSTFDDYDIAGRTVGSNGNLGPFISISATANNERDPDVGGERSDVDDEALVVWEEDGVGIRGTQVRLTVGQEAQIGAIPTLSETGTGIGFPAISKTPDDNGHFLVVWEEAVGNLDKIRGRTMSRNAVISSPTLLVSGVVLDFLSDYAPDVDTTGDAFVVAWAQRETLASSNHDIQVVRVRREGGVLDIDSSYRLIEDDDDDDEIRPSVAMTGESVAVAYHDFQISDYDAYLEVLDPYTLLSGAEVALDTSATSPNSVRLAARWQGGSSVSRELLAVWDSDSLLTNGDVMGRVHVTPDNTVSLGGGCGAAGEIFAPCSFEGNSNFRVHLRNSVAGALPILAVSPSSNNFACGPCTIGVNLNAVTLYVGSPVDADGNQSRGFAIPDPFGPMAFTVQWAVFNGGGCGFFGGFDVTDALRVDITAD